MIDWSKVQPGDKLTPADVVFVRTGMRIGEDVLVKSVYGEAWKSRASFVKHTPVLIDVGDFVNVQGTDHRFKVLAIDNVWACLQLADDCKPFVSDVQSITLVERGNKEA